MGLVGGAGTGAGERGEGGGREGGRRVVSTVGKSSNVSALAAAKKDGRTSSLEQAYDCVAASNVCVNYNPVRS